jgi:acetyl esterase/lipase
MKQIPITDRLDSPYAIVIRAVRGPADLAVVINHDLEGLSLSIWSGESREFRNLPFGQVTYATTITPDGRYILDLDDPTGSELGHLHATPVAGGVGRDLTPGHGSYTVRGLDCAIDGHSVLITAGDESGFYAVLSDVENTDAAKVIFRSENETWSGLLSADCTLSALETTDHNPGIRRFAVSVVDNQTSEVIATLSDGPFGPIRPIRFAQQPGDSRLLASSESSGFARPLVWDPISGVRIDIPLDSYVGDVVPLDWHSETGRLLLVHVEGGIHRLLEHDLVSGNTTPVQHPEGAFFEPDTGAEFPVIWSSYYAHDGTRRLVTSSWDVPLHILESRGSETPYVVLPPANVPSATKFESHTVTSRDGIKAQLWVGLPHGVEEPRGTILEVHGGPNLVSVDRYDALAQSWIDDGWAYAALNYRGSVTFGREFRESFWGRVGVGEIDDIDAAISWLESEGIASADSIFITGASYGGFLTLLALGKLPNRIAGGLAHVAQADWVAAYPQMNPALQTAWRGFVGSDPEVDPTPWEVASPISYVEHVRAPAWLNQGAFDTRTPPEQAQRYADSLREHGGDVVLDWFQGGHMPGGLAGLAHDYRRMKELTDKALRGERWDHD